MSATLPLLREGFVSQTARLSPLHQRDEPLPASGRGLSRGAIADAPGLRGTSTAGQRGSHAWRLGPTLGWFELEF